MIYNPEITEEYFKQYYEQCETLKAIAYKLSEGASKVVKMDSDLFAKMTASEFIKLYTYLCQMDLLKIAIADGELEDEEYQLGLDLVRVSGIDIIALSIEDADTEEPASWELLKELSEEDIADISDSINEEYASITAALSLNLTSYQLLTVGQNVISEDLMDKLGFFLEEVFAPEISSFIDGYLNQKIFVSKVDNNPRILEVDVITSSISSEFFHPLVEMMIKAGAIIIE